MVNWTYNENDRNMQLFGSDWKKIRLMHVNKLKKSYLNDTVHLGELE
jgi:hypothetical protein